MRRLNNRILSEQNQQGQMTKVGQIRLPATMVLTLICCWFMASAENDPRFDRINVVHYAIHLDVSDLASKSISGYTDVDYLQNLPLDSMVLYLESLEVDSIQLNGQAVTYTHTGKVLEIAASMSMADTVNTARIWYHGKPIRDASWGGFYFSGDYAYNLGVAFTSDPHNYGRVWFPCVDDFEDRALYDFYIITSVNDRAMCNGLLMASTPVGTTRTEWHWKLSDPIPTYLASIAVAPYTVRNFTHKGIPVTLAAVLSDSANMQQSFEHLPNAIDAFIQAYGPHRFERIGFNLVPFNSGAMEHATNIAYPRYAADGTFDSETLFAHELAHHWWGNSVTCSDAPQMWLNEGWASYSERVFLEYVYGRERYLEDISANHLAVLHYAHLRDGDTLAINGVGHTKTYGMHVYDKGADVIHTLRGYMGDSAFFAATSSMIGSHLFENITTDILKAHFQKYTTRDLTHFFDQWVNEPGFPAFDIIDWKVTPHQTGFTNNVVVRQRTRFAPGFFTHVPMELMPVSADFKTATIPVTLSGYETKLEFQTDFRPETIFIDPNQRISDAVTDRTMTISDTGSYYFGDALMDVNVTENTDSSWVRVEHYWVAPDAWFNDEGNPFLSRERYWNVSGVWNPNLKASARIDYNGRNTGLNYPDGYFDNDLIRIREDSLVLMYRETASSPWRIYPDYTLVMGSPFDKRGSIEISTLKRGEYALAMRDQQFLDIPWIRETMSINYLTFQPNPAEGEITFQVYGAKKACLEITNSSGQVLLKQAIRSHDMKLKVDTSQWAKGVYYAGVVMDDQPYAPKLFIVR